jgi:hypothetical protein
MTHRPEPKFRKQLNKNQLDILLSLYRFRFGTTELITEQLGKSNSELVRISLIGLMEQGYVARHFDGTYHLRGQYAAYYLLPKGLRTLQPHTEPNEITDTVIKNSYSDKTVTPEFIAHNLTLYKMYLSLSQQTTDLLLFTKRGLGGYRNFPKPLPDVFFSIKDGTDRRRFFVELFDSKPLFVQIRRAEQYIAYHQNQAWDKTKTPFPYILLICETDNSENWLQKRIVSSQQRLYDTTTLPFYTTTKAGLLQSTKTESTIWSDVTKPEKLYSLETLPQTA